MHGAQRAAKGHDGGIGVIPFTGEVSDTRNHLVDNVMIPRLMTLNAPAGVAAFICPGFIVNGINGIDGNLSAVNPGRKDIGHMEILKIIETSGLTGNEQYGFSLMAIYLELHIAAERG